MSLLRRRSLIAAMRKPSRSERLVHPERWAPAVAKKLRAGESLDVLEREWAAEVLEQITELANLVARRGCKSRERQVSVVHTCVRLAHEIIKASRKAKTPPVPISKAFVEVHPHLHRIGLSISTDQVRKAYYRQHRRLMLDNAGLK